MKKGKRRVRVMVIAFSKTFIFTISSRLCAGRGKGNKKGAIHDEYR